MEPLSPAQADSNDVQVVSIGNAYESAVRAAVPYESLPALFQADEAHLSQKSAYWLTPFGFPRIALCRAPLSGSADVVPASHFVCPPRASSSISADLLGDETARQQLSGLLQKSAPVYLIPYAWSAEAVAVAEWLSASGFEVINSAPSLTDLRTLNSKVSVHESIFLEEPELARLRPASAVATSLDDLRGAIAKVASDANVERVVVKSSIGVGGDGVFFVDTCSVRDGVPVAQLLRSKGYNDENIAAPFIVEAFIDAVASPTVDVIVGPSGVEWFCGAYEQRLFDGRYYAGFRMPSQARCATVAWYEALLDAAEVVSEALAARSYCGFLNIDFVVDGSGQVFLVELNPRLSALLDGIGLAHHWAGDAFKRDVSCADYIEAASPTSPSDAQSRLDAMARRPQSLAVVSLDAGFDSEYQWLGLVSVGDDAEELLMAGIGVLGGIPRDSSVEAEIGLASPW